MMDDRENKPANRFDTQILIQMDPRTSPFYRMEPNHVFSQLPRVRPSVLYIFAGQSFMCLPSMMQDKMDNTGVGQGGSGGVSSRKSQVSLSRGQGPFTSTRSGCRMCAGCS